jgi:hypothetical protein
MLVVKGKPICSGDKANTGSEAQALKKNHVKHGVLLFASNHRGFDPLFHSSLRSSSDMTDQQQRLSIRFPVLVNLVLPLIPAAQIGLRIIQVFDVIGFRERTASTFA